MVEHSRSQKLTNRRKFISSAALSGSLLASGAGLVGASSESLDAHTIQIRRDIGDPLAEEEIERKRTEAIEQWQQQRRLSDPNLVFSLPSTNEVSGEVYAYNFEITPNGTPVQHTGRMVRDPVQGEEKDYRLSNSKLNQDITTLHSEADRKANGDLSYQTDTPVTVSDLTTQPQDDPTIEKDVENWSVVGNDSSSVWRRPAGIIRYELIHRENTNTGHHAMQMEHDMEAGHQKHEKGRWEDGEFWRNRKEKVFNDWGSGQLNAEYEADVPHNDPDESIDSRSYSFSAGFPSGVNGSIGYTYSQDAIDVTNKTSSSIEKCQWDMECFGDDVQDHRAYWEPMSVCWCNLEEIPRCPNANITALSAKFDATWRNPYAEPGCDWPIGCEAYETVTHDKTFELKYC